VGTTVDSGDRLSVNGTSKFSSDVAVSGSTGLLYNAGQLGFTNTASGGQYGIYTLGTSNPIMFFDHRATGNTGSWSWRSGTGGTTTAMTLSNAGAATFSSTVTATKSLIGDNGFGSQWATFVHADATGTSNAFVGIDNSNGSQISNIKTNGTFEWRVSNSNVMNLKTTGNLLVGTTTDSGQKLQVVGTTISTATNIPFQSVVTSSEMYNSFFVNTSTLIGYIGNGDGIITNGGTNNFGIRAEADLIFAAGGNNRRMTITSGGNLLVGTTTDVASSKVTISSTTQGFLPPRMTTTQKNAIGTPAAGLQVYDTTLNQMSYYNGTTWVNF
jgi:hypothetical protein